MSEVWPEPDDFIRNVEKEQDVWPARYRAACSCGWRGAPRWDSDQAEDDHAGHRTAHGVP